MRRFAVLILAAVVVAGLAVGPGAAQAPIEDALVLQTPVSKFVVDAVLKAFAQHAKERWNVTVRTSALHAGTPVS